MDGNNSDKLMLVGLGDRSDVVSYAIFRGWMRNE